MNFQLARGSQELESHSERHSLYPQTGCTPLGTGRDTSFGWSSVVSSPRIVEMAEEVLGFPEHFRSLQAGPAPHKATAASHPLPTSWTRGQDGTGHSIGGWGRALTFSFSSTQLVPTPGPLRPAASSGKAPSAGLGGSFLQPLTLLLMRLCCLSFHLIFMCHLCSSCPLLIPSLALNQYFLV